MKYGQKKYLYIGNNSLILQLERVWLYKDDGGLDRQTKGKKERREERKKERKMDGWKSLFIHGYIYQIKINTTVQFTLTT